MELAHQESPNEWSCLPTAFAVCCDVEVAEFIEEIGHDGSDVIFDGVPDPYCRRSFHVEECLRVALDRGWAGVEFSPYLASLCPKTGQFATFDHNETIDWVLRRQGVILGQEEGKTPHAVAFQDYEAVDPAVDILKLNVQSIFLMVETKQLWQ